ncbi:hypothetical protein ACLK2E_23360 [Escherichia coli]
MIPETGKRKTNKLMMRVDGKEKKAKYAEAGGGINNKCNSDNLFINQLVKDFFFYQKKTYN